MHAGARRRHAVPRVRGMQSRPHAILNQYRLEYYCLYYSLLALRAAVKTAEKLYTRSRSETLVRATHHAFSGQYGILTESKSGLHDIQIIR